VNLLRKWLGQAARLAATGLIFGGVAMPPAKAAAIAGDCCADLEKRIAELETTATGKGNRNMSLTIMGQVHRMILWWDDGKSRGTDYGLDNTNSSTRFSFLGEAKVSSRAKVGFEIMYEIGAGGTSTKASQFDVDGKSDPQISGNDGVKSFTGNNVDAYASDVRRMEFWIEDSLWGRLRVGRYESAGAVTTIDLGGINAGADSSVIQANGSFLIRGTAGQYYAMKWSALGDPAVDKSRNQLVRWDSPTVAGFILTASIMEDGSNWGAMLRYANEFNGLRIAGGIGYEHWSQLTASNGCVNGAPDGTSAPCAGPADLANPRPDVSVWGIGLSALHVPSGFFAQGHYLAADFNDDLTFNGNQLQAGTFWGDTKNGRIPATQWLIQAGIAKNRFGIGNTALFVEYGRNEGWGAAGGTAAPTGASYSDTTIPGAVSVLGVVNTAMDVWGAGITQHLDAATTELYIDWRHFSANVTCSSTGVNCTGEAATLGTVPLQRLQTESFDAIIGGARVKF
jgi:hypothetical protein